MQTTTHPTELRLALVFNGGVSLAVWMAGVTHELDRLRRAEGPWRDLCRDANATVVVDIIAGTSAGGLNGTLLACAVAAGEPLPTELRDLWVRDAALTTGKLLDDTAETPQSLLDGGYLTKMIRSVVRPRAQRVAQRGGRPREPVTLFVTATATGGPQPRGTDALGQHFGYEDHRRLYRFVADAQRQVHDPEVGPHPTVRNDFTADEALVTAARASAGFPGAFPPVSEEPLLALPQLRVHPDVPDLRDLPTFLMDGGVLDNAPFAPVVEEMGQRTINGPYRRVLAYVVPSSGVRGAVVPARDVARLRPPLHAVVSGSLNLPREVDFRTDVDELDNRLAAASESPVDRLFDRLPDEGLLATAAELIQEYRQARTVDGIWKARRLLRRRPLATDLSRPSRIDAAGLDTLWVPPAGTPLGHALDGPLWTWGVSAAQQVVTTLLREVRRHLNGDKSAPACAEPQQLALSLSAALTKILAIDDAVRRATLSRAALEGIGPSASDEEIAGLVNAVFAEQRVREHLLVVVRSATAAYAESVGTSAAAVVERALAAEVLSRAFAAPSVRPHTPPFDFVRIGPDVDSPLVALGDYRDAGERKLFGTRVGHFGAFATEDARAHDWLWGRLDAAAHLVRLVLHDQPSAAVSRRVAEVQMAILDDEAGRAGAADGAALVARLAAAHHRVTGDNRELVRSFLRTDAGRATATGVARSATRLLTHGCFEAVNPAAPAAPTRAAWQHTVEAVVADDRPAELSLSNRLARASTGPLRSGLWSALRDDPTRVATRLRNRLILLLLGVAGLVFTLGGLVGAAVALYHSGDQVFRWTAFGLVLAVLVGFLTAALRTLAAVDPPPEPERPATATL
ncbi:hypothetical protein Ais01nite_06450 [Asanoa ishikariensis]|uniref:Patatin-related protein n=1 Tax=Asanoa ishikariensis TaxID=137265 RepID=A0A1H3TF13_9ACTN|nr:DUF3376 domain-containing protein [Asanoa ishikariensis]GIF62610.1 hypothetical protein Ais01nite_06450 [Asanoa ishikariensis]SDZ48421.1 patatin-related protein [Asanoa ishikariensis]